MDESENYHQRLQVIAERRRQQEEEKRLRKEAEEEWLKTAQNKRKCLREQWLSEAAPAPVPSSLNSLRPQEDEHTAAQKTPEEEAADAREQAFQETDKQSVSVTDTARTNYQPGTDEDAQVNYEAEDHFSIEMAQRMFHESGLDGRSVLGTVAVQVERDPKTGATVIRSVAPVSTPAGAQMATAIFDDGRKSIHAVGGGEGDQPSTEELGQILSAIDGVGMRVLLDETTVTPSNTETKIEIVDSIGAPEATNVLSFSTHQEDDDTMQSDILRSYDSDAELGIEEDCAASVGVNDSEYKEEERSVVVGCDVAAEEVFNVEDQKAAEEAEGPVTLLFLGYADASPDQGDGPEENGGMLTVERVMITEEGEEHVLAPETPAAAAAAESTQAGKEFKEEEVFQDVPLEGNGSGGVKVQAEGGDNGPQSSSSPIQAEGEGPTKRKTCQCCSVM